VLHEFGTGWVVLRIGRIPARTSKEPFRRAIDVVFPGREHPDMAPLSRCVTDTISGFQHDWVQPLLKRVGSGCKPDRTGADDCNRSREISHIFILLEL
jgi:hypothetical protein